MRQTEGPAEGQQAPVRLADVAEAAGVSTATVSRVLGRSDHRVNVQTRAKVEATARSLGYRVNPIARALRLSTTGSVGMVVPSISNPFFTELVEAVEHHLAAAKINLYLCDSRGDLELEASRLKSLSNGAVDGIIAVPLHASLSEPAVVSAAARVPVVQLDRQVQGLAVPWVGVEDRRGIRDIVGHLHKAGVRSLGMLTSTTASLSAGVRTDEVLIQAQALGMELLAEQTLDTQLSIEDGIAAASILVEAGPLPDAIICINDLVAIGLLNGLRRRGVSCPRDVFVTGIDGIRFSSIMVPTLTTVVQPLANIAAEGIRLLSDPLSSRTGITVALPGRLAVGESTGGALRSLSS